MTVIINNHEALAVELAELLQKSRLLLAVAESCTGGSLGARLTSIAGSSAWFDRGFITYSNEAKHEMLGVAESILIHDGAVSEAAARAMAEGCIKHSAAGLSVAITGIAGPGGGSQEKPVGTVWIASAGARQKTTATCFNFEGDREAVRQAAELHALKMLISRAQALLPPPNNQEPTYFFTLMPDPATASALYQRARVFTEHTSCQPTPPENLHLTLAYLGRLHTAELNNLTNLKSPCPIAPFELIISDVKHWSEINISYLAPSLSSEPLEKLHAFLNQHIVQQGLKPERRAFVPHITITRDDSHGLKSHKIKPVPWFIHELCLVQSPPRAPQASSDYTIIQRWPMKLA
ncbi:MAG: RNA 2',3'-cyclic phosphodiesterase [Legionellaceae bacterium]|nr:RNA 2',3'-cyclic phosphodiesterase [Legionellaceae bacterium]